MTHPNALPDDKVDYVQSLHQQKGLRIALGISLPQLALLMYHCEVPYRLACDYLSELGRSAFRTPAMPAQMPDDALNRLFSACGANVNESANFIATLNTRR